jgi:uncharacterized membrane protein
MKSRLLRTSLGLMALLATPGGLIAQAQGPKAARYTVTDLGTLGGANSFAYSISDSGMVAGGANTPGQNDVVAQTAFIWYGGQPINLGTLGGPACPDCSSEGSAVSANGTAALLSETAIPDSNGEDFCEFNVNRPTRTNHQCLAAVWKDGTLTALPTLPGGDNAEAFFYNKQGEAVGVSETGAPDATSLTPSKVRRFEAVKWSASGQITALPPLPGDTVSFAFANNDVGQATGMSGLCSNVILPPFVPGSPLAPHAVLWEADGTPRDLTPPGAIGVLSIANAINNQGDVVLNSLITDGAIHSFLWTRNSGVPQDLGTYPQGAVVTVVPCCNNINDRGQIVGFSLDAGGNLTALLWPSENAAPVDLNNLVSADSPWYLLFPGGITNAGEIAATAVNLNTFELHAVVASPITGIGPAARGATKPPALPQSIRKFLQRQLHLR